MNPEDVLRSCEDWFEHSGEERVLVRCSPSSEPLLEFIRGDKRVVIEIDHMCPPDNIYFMSLSEHDESTHIGWIEE